VVVDGSSETVPATFGGTAFTILPVGLSIAAAISGA
jgi:hypothetical protein